MAKSEDTAAEVARILLDVHAVAINTVNPYVYASGTISPIYCDLRLLMSTPRERLRIVDLLVGAISETVASEEVDVIAGVATAGISWAAWVAEALRKPMAYVRVAPKEHGKQQRIEGTVTAGQRTVVLEDLTSTGASAISTAQALREVGATADYCFSVFTYGFKRATQAFADAKIKLVTLCGISTLLEVASSRGDITREEEEAVREWLRRGPVIATRVDAEHP